MLQDQHLDNAVTYTTQKRALRRDLNVFFFLNPKRLRLSVISNNAMRYITRKTKTVNEKMQHYSKTKHNLSKEKNLNEELQVKQYTENADFFERQVHQNKNIKYMYLS